MPHDAGGMRCLDGSHVAECQLCVRAPAGSGEGFTLSTTLGAHISND